MTGFATSVIGCKCEAGIERELDADETPDGRPGVSALLFAMDREGVGKRLVERVGQTRADLPDDGVLRRPRTPRTRSTSAGSLRYFGDGYQASKVLDGRRYWRDPGDGGRVPRRRSASASAEGVGGGNFLILARDDDGGAGARPRRRRARCARSRASILPFPGGIVRSGSKVGSRYKAMPASTNDALCPTLRGQVDAHRGARRRRARCSRS